MADKIEAVKVEPKDITVVSQSGVRHRLIGRSARFTGRVATLCGMNLRDSDPQIEDPPDCQFCVSAIKLGDAIRAAVKDLQKLDAPRSVSALAEYVGVSEQEIRDAVGGMWDALWGNPEAVVLLPTPVKAVA